MYKDENGMGESTMVVFGQVAPPTISGAGITITRESGFDSRWDHQAFSHGRMNREAGLMTG
jgi:hypothetical protein